MPLTFDLIKNEEGKQLLRAGGLLPSTITRVYATTPGTPKDRVKLLQNGFAETLKDKAFMADAEKAKLETDPLTGEQVAKAVAEMFNIDESLQTKQNDSHVKVIGARWPIGVASYLSGATPVF